MHVTLRITVLLVVGIIAALALHVVHLLVVLAGGRSVFIALISSIVVGFIIGLLILQTSNKLGITNVTAAIVAGVAALLGWYWLVTGLVDGLVVYGTWTFTQMEEMSPTRLEYGRFGYGLRSLDESLKSPVGMLVSGVAMVGAAVSVNVFSERLPDTWSLRGDLQGKTLEQAPVCQRCGSEYVTKVLFSMPASRFAGINVSMREVFATVESANEFLENSRRRTASANEREVRGTVMYCDKCLQGELLVQTYAEGSQSNRQLVREESYDLDSALVRHFADNNGYKLGS